MTSSNRKRVAVATAALTIAGFSACGGDGGLDVPTASSSSAPTSSAPQPQMLDTAQVLALAQKQSETTEPFGVVDGLVVLTDTSETTQPIAVDATAQ